MNDKLSILFLCGFTPTNETGVHRFSKVIVKGISSIIPSTYAIYWNKQLGSIRSIIRLIVDFFSIINKVKIIHFSVMTPVQIPFIIISKLMSKKIITTYQGNYKRTKSITTSPHLRLFFWLGDKIFRRFSDILVSPSQSLLNELGLDPAKSFVIPNPYSAPELTKSNPFPRENKNDIIFSTASNFNIKEKVDSLKLLIDVMERITTESKLIKLLVFGDGIHLPEIKSRCLSNNIIFKGFRDDFREFLAISDVYVHITGLDVQPYALLDALMQEKVVICSDIEVLREFVDPRNNYFVSFDLDSILKTVCSVITEIKSEPEAFYNKGKLNKTITLERFSLDKISVQYRELYIKLIDKR